MAEKVIYKLKDGRKFNVCYNKNGVAKVSKKLLEQYFGDMDIAYEQAKILEKIKENYALMKIEQS